MNRRWLIGLMCVACWGCLGVAEVDAGASGGGAALGGGPSGGGEAGGGSAGGGNSGGGGGVTGGGRPDAGGVDGGSPDAGRPDAGSPSCADAVDNDSDGLIDFPLDPDCAAPTSSEVGVVQRQKTYAWAWGVTDAGNTHLVQMHMLVSYLPNTYSVAGVRTALDQQPAGHHVVMSWDLHAPLDEHPADRCRRPNGTLATLTRLDGGPYSPYCPWWDAGVPQTRALFSSLFAQYADAGIAIDELILDYEDTGSGNPGISDTMLSNWHVGADIVTLPDGSTVRIAGGRTDYSSLDAGNLPRDVYDTMAADPRFAADNPGFTDLRSVWDWYCLNQGAANGSCAALGIMASPVPWMSHYSHWALTHVTQQAHAAIFEPAQAHYPQLRGSNWLAHYLAHQGNDYRNSEGWQLGGCPAGFACGVSQRRHFGTHQGAVIEYGVFDRLSLVRLDGVNLFEKTPFHQFLFAMQQLRYDRLGSPVPLHAWLAPKTSLNCEPVDGGCPPNSSSPNLLTQSDLYQEQIFHALLTQVERIILWNLHNSHPGAPLTLFWDADEALVDRCLSEFDLIGGFAPRVSRVTGPAPWGAKYLLSGANLGGRLVWRYTPELQQGQVIDSIILSGPNAPLRLRTPAGRELVFPQGVLFTPPSRSSTQGLWIVQPLQAPAPYELP